MAALNVHWPGTPIRLLLVDDHLLVREGIRSCLAAYPHLRIVGEAADGEVALTRARELNPDVVLMDVNLPGINGLETTSALLQRAPEIRVLVLTVHNHREYVLQIVRCGARGYVLKDTSPQELVRAIETVHGGGVFFSPDVAQFLLKDYVVRASTGGLHPGSRLSARERDVLASVAEGKSNKQIADQLRVSVRTVETHRERIMKKLNIHTIAGLTKFAIANGIITLD